MKNHATTVQDGQGCSPSLAEACHWHRSSQWSPANRMQYGHLCPCTGGIAPLKTSYGRNLAHQVQQQQLLYGVVLRGQHVSNDCNKKSWDLLSIQQHHDGLLQGLDFCHRVIAFQCLLDLRGGRWLVKMHQHGAAAFHGLRHDCLFEP